MKTIKSYADLQAAIKSNPKAYAASAGIATVGTIATLTVATSLTTTAMVNGVATTVKAGLLAKSAVVVVGIAATAAASYYVYNKLTETKE